MNIALAKTDTGRAVSDAFAAARDRLPGVGKVAEVRRQAFAAFERSGLPHRRIEEWKYTDLRALLGEVKPLAPKPDAAALERARAALQAHAVGARIRRMGKSFTFECAACGGQSGNGWHDHRLVRRWFCWRGSRPSIQ